MPWQMYNNSVVLLGKVNCETSGAPYVSSLFSNISVCHNRVSYLQILLSICVDKYPLSPRHFIFGGNYWWEFI